MSTGTTIFLIALVILVIFGVTTIWQTFHGIEHDPRGGAGSGHDAVKRAARRRPRRGGEPADDDVAPRHVRDNRPRRGFDVDDDIKPGAHETPRHGRHEFR